RDGALLVGFGPASDRQHGLDVPADEPFPPAAMAEARFPALRGRSPILQANRRRLTMQHAIASREDWLAARKALFDKERALTHQLDTLRAERRRLPWVRVEKRYVFDGPEGEVALGDLFGDRSQLAIYHFMLTPGSDHLCPGCSFTMDH